MSVLRLVYKFMADRKMSTILNIVLLSLGISVICILLSFSRQLDQNITTNSRGIDLVVGAKGSPLQLILCNVFQADFPTGNIRLEEANKLARHRLVKNAIPLSIGDSYEGYRVVGTTRQYGDLYNASVVAGTWFHAPMEAVVGSKVADHTGLAVGDTFSSSHGLGIDGDHHDHSFKVTGVMGATGTVVDNLILTSLASIWEVHEHEEEDLEHEEHHESDSSREITALLLQFRNPIAAIQLPRQINSGTNMQAASPAFETARLLSLLGIGVDVVVAFAGILIVISGLSIFIALYNSLKERRYDMAIMRAMGASRSTLVKSVVLEGVALTASGALLGLLLGHIALFVFGVVLPGDSHMSIQPFAVYREELFLMMLSVLFGTLTSLLPAIQVYRLNIHNVLANISAKQT